MEIFFSAPQENSVEWVADKVAEEEEEKSNEPVKSYDWYHDYLIHSFPPPPSSGWLSV